jgi:hypothetical protein
MSEYHKRAQYEITQFNTNRNEIKKQIWQKKKANEDTNDLLKGDEIQNKKKA